MASRTSNVLKNSVASIFYKFSHMLVQFVIRTAFIKLLGKEYTGISSLFADILTVLSLMDLGMGSAMIFSLYKPMAEGNSQRIASLMDFYKKAYHLIGCLVILVGMLCTPFLQYIVTGVPNIKEDIRLIFIMYVLTSACSYFLVYKTVLLRANQQARIISRVNTIAEVVECIIEIILLLVFKEFMAYLIVRLVGALSRNLILTGIARKQFPQYLSIKAEKKLSREEIKALFKDIFALGVYKVSGVMIYSTPSIIISAFVSTAEVAVVGCYTMITNSLRTAIEQVVESTKASIGNLAATSSKEKQESVFNTMNFIAFAVSCFCCTCLFVLLTPFVTQIWFDESYRISFSVVVVLVINFFIAIMVYPVESFRTANGLFVQGKWRPAIMAVVNLILSISFVQYLGVLGVYLASVVSRLSTQVWFDAYLIYKYVFKKRPWKYYADYAIKLGITVISCMVAYGICGLITIDIPIIAFVCKGMISALISLVFVVGLNWKNEALHSAKRIALRMISRKVKK